MTLLSLAAVYCTASLTKGSDAIFGTFSGPNSFYAVIPYAAMLVPFSILALLVVVAFWRGVRNFWKETASGPETLLSRHGNLGAVWDVLTLKYLEGGGHVIVLVLALEFVSRVLESGHRCLQFHLMIRHVSCSSQSCI